MPNSQLSNQDLEAIIVEHFPYPVAVNYQRMLETGHLESKVRLCLQIFEYTLRAMALGLVSQYLIRDKEETSGTQLNNLLSRRRFRRATLGEWNELFFATLKTYEGERQRFFIPELYDMYWETDVQPHRPRKGVRKSFQSLVEIRNEVAHGVPPVTEAGWQKELDKVRPLLHDVLSRFVFLKNYELIRVVNQTNIGYEIDIFTGRQIETATITAPTDQLFGEGWFYLSKEKRTKFLQLHPLFIEWVGAEHLPEFSTDAALYDKFSLAQLTYLATVLRNTISISDETSIKEFVQLIFEAVERVKQQRETYYRLNWWLLQRIAGEISNDRMGDAWQKYNRDVYFVRETADHTFQDFLRSDTKLLLITGQSGVGKSNFILSLAEKFADDPLICPLLYNGARLSEQIDFEKEITHDFAQRLRLDRGDGHPQEIDDILFEIQKIQEIAQHHVIVFIDALNENPHAKELLRQINRFVETVPYSWLKVVVSCRPETWRMIRQGIPLAEHKFYKTPGAEDFGLELLSFSREEIPFVYEQYRQQHEIQTEYSTLPIDIREFLRDPLSMKLVAETYQKQVIPKQLSQRAIYEKYIQYLLKSNRLERTDILFLEQEILPLMINKERLGNAIPGHSIDVAQTKDGRSLFELIHNEEILQSKRQVNQSYTNLADALILMEQETDTDYVLTFQYERIFEYFGGKQLYMVNCSLSDRVDAYLQQIEQIVEKPFLWGVVRNALVLELLEGDKQIVVDVALSGEALAQDIFVASVVEFAQDNRVDTMTFVQSLYDYEKEDLFSRACRHLRHRLGKKPTKGELLKRLVIRIAEQIGDQQTLERAAISHTPAIRAITSQHIYYLWQRQWQDKQPENQALTILENLSAKIRGPLGLPRPRVVEACLSTSTQIAMDLILFADAQDPNRVQLTEIGQSIVADIFTTGDNYKGWQKSVAALSRRVALRIGVQVGLQIISLVERAYQNWFAVTEIRHYFASLADGEQKQLIRKVAPYMNPAHGSMNEIRQELFRLTEKRDFFSHVILGAIMTTHGLDNPETTLPLLQEILAHSFSIEPPPPALTETILAIGGLFIDKPQLRTVEYLDMFAEYVSKFHEVSRSRVVVGNDLAFIHTHLSWYLLFYHMIYGRDDAPYLDRYIELAVAESDLEAINHLGKRLVSLATELRIHDQAQRRAIWALCYTYTAVPATMQEPVVNALARIYVYFPYDVLDLLSQADLFDLVRTIRLRTPVESSGDIVGGRVTWFIRYAILANPERLARLAYVAEQSANLKSLGAWLELVLRELIMFVPDEAKHNA